MDLSKELPATRFVEIPATRERGKWTIEVPNMPDADIFIQDAVKLIPQALEDCSWFTRKIPTTVQFVPEIIKHTGTYQDKVIRMRGTGHSRMEKRTISISLNKIRKAHRKKPNTHWKITALGILLHELFEEDYLRKTPNYQDTYPVGHPEYYTQEDEDIADQRTLAFLHKRLRAQYIIDKGSGALVLSSSHELE